MTGLDAAYQAMLFEPEFDWRASRGAGRMLRRFGGAALDLMYPPHCVSCDVPLPAGINGIICAACVSRIQWIGEDRCVRCGDATGTGSGRVEFCVSCKQTPPRFVQATVCMARYEKSGPAREMVLGLKFGGRADEAKLMGRMLARRIEHTHLLDGISNPILIPAPLMRATLLWRGYNQAAELAYWIARELKLKLAQRLLIKTRVTLPQATLSEKRRRENLAGAFACPARAAKKFEGANILLIDDVITTGSTISECARTLRGAGMGRIVAASFARG